VNATDARAVLDAVVTPDASTALDAPAVLDAPSTTDASSSYPIVEQVAVGGGRTCAILSGAGLNGAVKCFGYVAGGFLGLGDMSTRGDLPGTMGAALPAVDLGSGVAATEVSLGYIHTCAVLADGGLKCWGGNNVGQLGLGDTSARGEAPGTMGDRLPRVNVGTAATVVSVSAGYEITCAVLVGGRVKCWGANDGGALGLGDTVARGANPGDMGDALPYVDLGTGKVAVAVTAGSGHDSGVQHACALLDDGSVKCWGNNLLGELGLGDTMARGDRAGTMGDALPSVDLGTGRHALGVSAGYGFTCALLDDHSVKCWGAGELLGIGAISGIGTEPGDMGDRLPAIDFGSGHKALAVQAGYSSACAVLDDHSVKCWGLNYAGQLGVGDTALRGAADSASVASTPAVALGTGRSAMELGLGTGASAGGTHVCGLLDHGAVKCWGSGGELGLEDRTPRGDKPNEMGDSLPEVRLY
jgi:alpha-tubulin suppressor-like RCC1 family protein